MEQEQPHHHRGGIYNYFQGATIHNIVINGNMNKYGNEQYNISSDNRKQATPEQIIRALFLCKENGLIWGNAAYSVAFCVCRDEYSQEDNAANFERLLSNGGIAITPGTINTAMNRNPWLKYHIDKWEEMGVAERALTLRDEFKEQMENLLIQQKKTA